MSSTPDLITPPDLAHMNGLFADFLLANPLSTIERRELDGVRFIVTKPWGDETIELLIPPDPGALATALNDLRLPARLSAIWHVTSNSLEVIWTANSVRGPQSEIVGRAFKFNYKGYRYDCSFGDSSESLETVANYMVPLGPSPTLWRNLVSFQGYARVKGQADFEEHKALFGYDRPRSFWIRGFPAITEDGIVDVISNLNFYLRYYDDRSPTVIIHDPHISYQPRTRYLTGGFPIEIDALSLDENLVSFWNATESGNPMLRYLIHYRILEYAASMYVESHVRSEIIRLLSQPHLLTNKYAAVEHLSIAIGKSKLDDSAKLQAIMRDIIAPPLIWKEIQRNIDFFSRETKFEGGFTIAKLCQQNQTEEGFCNPSSITALAITFRKLRNALSHGVDQETAGVITPTGYNQRLFLPWVNLIQTAAGEVVLYKDAH